MSIHWYPHHIGDYFKNTRHLSILEHGAYRLLLDYHYTIGGPFRNDPKSIYRYCGALNSRERRAIDSVLSQFFVVANEGFLKNNRTMAEISKQLNIKELRKKAGAKAHANAEQKNQQMQTHPHPHPHPHPTPKEYINGHSSEKPTGKSTVEALIRKWEADGIKG